MGLGASRHDYLLFKTKGEVGQKIRSRECQVFELLLTGLTIQF